MNTKKSEMDFLSSPNRQSKVAILIILLKFFRIIVRQGWPLILVFLINPSGPRNSYISYIVIAVAFLSTIISIISYFKFYFYIQGDEVIIEKGVIQKKRLNVPFDRIQTINFEQGIIHQMFNVVSLEIDTAGSKGKEFTITALSKERAEIIRSYLLSKKGNQTASIEETTTETPPEKLLLHLSFVDLMKVGVGQNHLRTAGLILVSIFGFFEFFEDALGKEFSDQLGYLFQEGFDSMWYKLVLYLLPVLLLASFLLSLIRTVIRYFDLSFFKTNQGFKIVAGLFTKTEQSANMNKIQLIHWNTNPLMQYFKLYNLTLSQAASTALARKQSFFVPGAYAPQLRDVRNAYFPEEQLLDFEVHGISPLFIWRRTLYIGILPVLAFMGFKFFAEDTISWLGLAWILIVLVASYFYQKRWFYFVSEKGLRLSRGLISRKDTLLKWYKIQSVKVSQGIYQRRKHLANIEFYTAAGTVKISYIELEKAIAIQDFALYRIENSQRQWM